MKCCRDMSNILEIAQNIVKVEIEGINALTDVLDDNFLKIVNVISSCKGHTIITGVGKSGNIATKISASMSSLGIPSFFIDPANAGHGDIGVITENDVLIAISNSGESSEILAILNYCFGKKIPTILITRNDTSSIAKNADLKIIIPPTKEAHDFNAPTTSTTQTLVIGDILAICASKMKGFTKEKYASLHPSGNLGMKISKVTTIMNHNFATVEKKSHLLEVLEKMTESSNGFVCVVEDDKICGIITDGDLRRYILKNHTIENLKAESLYNSNPKFVTDEQYIIDVVEIMTLYKVQVVIIIDNNHKPIGFISRNQFNI